MKKWFWMAPIAGLALMTAGSAHALTMSVGVATNAPNTADVKTDTTTNYNEYRSTRTVLDSGGSVADGVGNNVDGKTAYQSLTAADGGIFTNANRTGVADYKITFTVNAGVGWFYNVTIDTSRLGALTLVDDGSASASAALTAVAAKLNGVANGTLGLPLVTTLSSNSGGNTPFSQTSTTVTLTGLTGLNVITLDFTWSSTANSVSGLTGGDEAAIRLGMPGTGGGTPGTTADDYPGVGARTAANDGHFVTVKATETSFVPEPGTLLLLGAGVAGLAVAGRKRS